MCDISFLSVHNCSRQECCQYDAYLCRSLTRLTFKAKYVWTFSYISVFCLTYLWPTSFIRCVSCIESCSGPVTLRSHSRCQKCHTALLNVSYWSYCPVSQREKASFSEQAYRAKCAVCEWCINTTVLLLIWLCVFVGFIIFCLCCCSVVCYVMTCRWFMNRYMVI